MKNNQEKKKKNYCSKEFGLRKRYQLHLCCSAMTHPSGIKCLCYISEDNMPDIYRIISSKLAAEKPQLNITFL